MGWWGNFGSPKQKGIITYSTSWLFYCHRISCLTNNALLSNLVEICKTSFVWRRMLTPARWYWNCPLSFTRIMKYPRMQLSSSVTIPSSCRSGINSEVALQWLQEDCGSFTIHRATICYWWVTDSSFTSFISLYTFRIRYLLLRKAHRCVSEQQGWSYRSDGKGWRPPLDTVLKRTYNLRLLHSTLIP